VVVVFEVVVVAVVVVVVVVEIPVAVPRKKAVGTFSSHKHSNLIKLAVVNRSLGSSTII